MYTPTLYIAMQSNIIEQLVFVPKSATGGAMTLP